MQKILYEKRMLIGGVLAMVALGAILHFYFGFWRTPQGEATFKEEYGITLTDYSGNEVRLSEFKRQVLLVYLWASWCPYCDEELENLAQIKDSYGEDLYIVAVNRAEPFAEARAFTDALKGSDKLIFLLDKDDALYKQVGGYAMPETLFINKWGDIVFHQRGPMGIEEVKQKIVELIQ